MSSQTIQTPVRQLIQEKARTYLGVKWRHQGRSKAVGIDCAGLVVLVGSDLRILNYDTTSYQRNAHNDAFVSHFADNLIKKRIADREPGDVLLFRDKLFSCHSAILTTKHGVEHIVHAYATRKKVVEEPLLQDWLDKMSYCFAYKGAEN